MIEIVLYLVLLITFFILVCRTVENISCDQFTESDISNDGQHNYADYDLFDANFTDDSARTSTPTTPRIKI